MQMSLLTFLSNKTKFELSIQTKSVFIYHLCIIFGHVSKTCQPDLDSVISLASSMAHCNFPSISAIYERCFKQRCLRMYATDLTPCLNWSNCPQAGTDS